MPTLPERLRDPQPAPVPPPEPDAIEKLLSSFRAQDAHLRDLALAIRDNGDLLRRAPRRIVTEV